MTISETLAPNKFQQPPSADLSDKYIAGVRTYASGYYDPDYVPKETDLLYAFRITTKPPTDMIEAAAAVVAESSTGTWTEVWSNQLADLEFFKARVYDIQDDIAFIAYPMNLFEENSVVNIMSSIVGNVFGMKAMSALRLEDMRIPAALVKTFPGPHVGICDERVWADKWERPLLGGTVKPKLGLSPKAYSTIIYECLMGGLDTTKDDENMNSQPFSRWRDRFRYAQEAVEEAKPWVRTRSQRFAVTITTNTIGKCAKNWASAPCLQRGTTSTSWNSIFAFCGRIIDFDADLQPQNG